jgi:hypothetical protein
VGVYRGEGAHAPWANHLPSRTGHLWERGTVGLEDVASMSTERPSFTALDHATVPQTTPRHERQRLIAKGQMLAEHCLDNGENACVIGFVEHCLGQSPPHLDVIVELWHRLRREQDQFRDKQEQPRGALLQALLQEIASHLRNATPPVHAEKADPPHPPADADDIAPH